MNIAHWLARQAQIAPDQPALHLGTEPVADYGGFDRAARCFAAALSARGIAAGDRVALFMKNVPDYLIAQYGAWYAGAAVVPINAKLHPRETAWILENAGASLCVTSPGLSDGLSDLTAVPLVETGGEGWDEMLAYTPAPEICFRAPDDLAWLFYTSGTTGRPKGVVYHHRGAYLNAMGQVLSWRMVLNPVYLTIVPLFHCNGWCHTWMLPMVGGTMVCCRDITAPALFDAFADEGVTHFGGAPIVLNMLVNAPEHERRDFDQVVNVFTAGAPPAPATLTKIEPMGFNVTQVYGLTETYGPATECLWTEEWDTLEGDARAAIKARQGVAMPIFEQITVLDEQLDQIPMDGSTQGEIVMRGNGVMKGYLKNPEATAEAFKGGVFHSGDIAVQHPDSYIQIADRAKDIIISGGENISSVEVEGVLMGHPAVLLAAVVAKPDEKWGEVPCAFVELKDGAEADEAGVIAFCREVLAGFKTPKKVVFQELPKTSTGKIQKFELRKVAAAL